MITQLWNLFYWREFKPDLYHLISCHSSSLIEDVGEISLSSLARKTTTHFNVRLNVGQMSEQYLLLSHDNTTFSKFCLNTSPGSTYCRLRTKVVKYFQITIRTLMSQDSLMYLSTLPPRQFKYQKPINMTENDPGKLFFLNDT